MKSLLSLLVLSFVPWCGWAACSDGGFTELKGLNPKFDQEDRALAHLVALYNDHDEPTFWQTHHVESCSFYMPNWSDADECVRARMLCDAFAPLNQYGEADVFSAEYRECITPKMPFRGPLVWLRVSRSLARAGVFFGVGYVACGGEMNAQCEETHNDLFRSLFRWMERSS